MGTAETSLNVLLMSKINFEKRNTVLAIEKNSCLVVSSTALKLHLLSVKYSQLREVKIKTKFQIVSSKSGRGRLRMVLWNIGRSRTGGRLREVVATGGSTVACLLR